MKCTILIYIVIYILKTLFITLIIRVSNIYIHTLNEISILNFPCNDMYLTYVKKDKTVSYAPSGCVSFHLKEARLHTHVVSPLYHREQTSNMGVSFLNVRKKIISSDFPFSLVFLAHMRRSLK